MRGLHQEVHQGRDPSAPGADLRLAGELGGDVRHPQYPVRREQRRDAAVVARHDRVGELAAQRLELDTVSDDLKGTHHLKAAAASRATSSRGTSRRCWSTAQRCPNGSMNWPVRSPQNASCCGSNTVAPAARARCQTASGFLVTRWAVKVFMRVMMGTGA